MVAHDRHMYVGLAAKHIRQAFVSDETVEEEGKLPSICRYFTTLQ